MFKAEVIESRVYLVHGVLRGYGTSTTRPVLPIYTHTYTYIHPPHVKFPHAVRIVHTVP